MLYVPFAKHFAKSQNPETCSGTKRVLIVFYAADYREIHNRLEEGLGETYHAHRYSLDVISHIGQEHGEATVLCCHAAESYREWIGERVLCVGMGPESHTTGDLIRTIQQLQPTHLILKVPSMELLRWAIRTRTRTAVLFADSFPERTLKHKLKKRLLCARLNHPVVEWVGNHGPVSCQALAQLGVKTSKIIPWDWPHTWGGYEPKELTPNQPEYSAIFVGSVQESKGVGDLIEAIARLKVRGLTVKLSIAGSGELADFRAAVRDLDIADRVEFLGVVAHSSIVARMRQSDFVVVPSRHSYPEGFPLTIYEALSSRSLPIASDHPMFVPILKHEVNALLFPAGNPDALADCIQTAISQPELYRRLSAATHSTWKALQLPVKWGDFIGKWLEDSVASREWLASYSLARTPYVINGNSSCELPTPPKDPPRPSSISLVNESVPRLTSPIIHIGYPKTGSTWLQQCVFNQPSLGFFPISSGTGAEQFIQTNDFCFSPETARNSFVTELETATQQSLVPVLSNEILAGDQIKGAYWGKTAADRIHATFPQAKILLLIREQKSILLSSYREFIKLGGTSTLETFIGSGQEKPGFAPICQFDHFKYHLLVEYYRQLFGAERLLVLPFEYLNADRNDAIRRLLNFADLTPTLSDIQLSQSSRNVGHNAAAIAVRRQLNFICEPGFFGNESPPVTWRMAQKISRFIDILTPRAIYKPIEDSWKAYIKERVGDRYRNSNRITSQLIGFDLSRYGYET